MIEIKKDPRVIMKRFRCSNCDCEFTAAFEDVEYFFGTMNVACPVCKEKLTWADGEDIIIENK